MENQEQFELIYTNFMNIGWYDEECKETLEE